MTNIVASCKAEGGCGEGAIPMSPETLKVFYPSPRQMRLGAQVFAIIDCPHCTLATRQTLVQVAIDALEGGKYKLFNLPEPESQKSKMEADEILDMLEAFPGVEPRDLMPV